MRYLLMLPFLLLLTVGQSQSFNRLEYFIDTDPGFGNATSVNIAGGTTINQTFNVDLQNVNNGLHILYVRARDTDNNWSQLQRVPFIRYDGMGLVSNNRIVQAEYFIDTDPGFGSANAFSFTSGATIDLSQTIDLQAIANGLHILYIRVKDQLGRWSLLQAAPFIRLEGVGGNTRFVALEYFIDDDPGFGSGIAIPFSEGNTINVNQNINLSSISNGVHNLYIRAKDNLGRWSLLASSLFVKTEGNGLTPEIVEIEFFSGIDPGFGNGALVNVSPAQRVESSYSIPTTSLSEGENELYFRTKDNFGRWSLLQQITIDYTAPMGCPPDYTLDNSIGGGTFQVANTITSTATISSQANVDFLAGQSIQLKSGFHAKAGSNFTARIEPCAPITSQQPVAKSQPTATNLTIAPNPFTDVTTISFSIPEPSAVQLSVFNHMGRLVQTIMSSNTQAAGDYQVRLNGGQLAGGFYFVRLQVDEEVMTQKVVMLRQ